ncbi:MAG: hypothetical protein EXR76_09200 [Myxococcales bacterium]|nr:hypothetical protein [Myxococcales bacterium]
MRTLSRFLLSTSLGLATTGLTGCTESAPELDPTAPAVTGLGTQTVVVGQTLWLDGNNLLPPPGGSTRLHFRGEYHTKSGASRQVRLTISPIVEARAGGQVSARWTRFGPFSHPFDAAGEPGTFRGQIVAETLSADGTSHVDSRPRTFSLDVGPSIVIEQFEPDHADCGAPAVRGHAGLAYTLRARATGLVPVRWTYALAEVNGFGGLTEYGHDVDPLLEPGTDVLGDGADEPVIFNPVPEDAQFYVSGLRIVAFDAAGNSVETALPFTVHRPIEVAMGGELVMAERYEPVPASSCIPGSIETRVTYSESRTEHRQRSVSMTVAQSFAQSHGQSESATWSEGISTGRSESQALGGSESESEQLSESHGLSYGESASNSTQVSTSDGEHWEVNLTQGESQTDYEERTRSRYGEASAEATIGAEVEGSLPFIASASGSVSTTAGVTAGMRSGGTEGERNGHQSETGYSMAGSEQTTRDYGSTTAESRSTSISDEYALTSQRSRDFSDETTREQSEVWSMGHGKSEEDIVSVGDEVVESETWSSSSSDRTVTEFSGFIPNGKGGLFYRQTTRFVRRAEVKSFDLCGVASHLGELQFNHWTWAPELAIAERGCDETPKSAFPPATCFLEPCGG